MEKLFTIIERQKIIEEAEKNLDIYLDTYVMSGDSDETNIITISKINHLIVTQGNEDTGFTHLNNRHGFFSFKNYWIENNELQTFKLDKPSKFHPNMMPIIDFIKVADAIFNSDNKNITKNNHPDIFDKYTGEYSYTDEQREKYHLLTYKDTKIIHSLFPDKKKHNRKTKIKYGKGIVTCKTKFPIGYNDLLIPYENKDSITAYSILVRKYYKEKVERLIIQKHDIEGNPQYLFVLGERTFNDYESFTHEDMLYYQHEDLKDLEDIITHIDNIEICIIEDK
ncbi:hypothetical protein GGR21_003941 [Dysgonomonas hofstadii]|uniref:Uncharacterized protein n=1 Tax=Dysgonomonas hofstadii TaxID=637886 RepID=A0A840CZ66_9BACT|nr:hypothetical protein [Dysgonomonas hofstadii]MBB4038015.1 hypothetical protein [Dysgonomonas hofstadii]